MVSVRCPRSRPRCSMSAPVASETSSPFSASKEISACSAGLLEARRRRGGRRARCGPARRHVTHSRPAAAGRGRPGNARGVPLQRRTCRTRRWCTAAGSRWPGLGPWLPDRGRSLRCRRGEPRQQRQTAVAAPRGELAQVQRIRLASQAAVSGQVAEAEPRPAPGGSAGFTRRRQATTLPATHSRHAHPATTRRGSPAEPATEQVSGGAGGAYNQKNQCENWPRRPSARTTPPPPPRPAPPPKTHRQTQSHNSKELLQGRQRRWLRRVPLANALRRRRPRPGDKWHLDEVFIRINGASTTCGARSTSTATCSTSWCSAPERHGRQEFFRKLLKGLRYVPRVIVTDKLGSYQVAHRALCPSVDHRRSKYLNNRAENSHQPTENQERAMRGFHRLAGPAIPVRVQRHLPALPASPAPTPGHRVPRHDERPLLRLERDHRASQRRLSPDRAEHRYAIGVPIPLIAINVTVPSLWPSPCSSRAAACNDCSSS